MTIDEAYALVEARAGAWKDLQQAVRLCSAYIRLDVEDAGRSLGEVVFNEAWQYPLFRPVEGLYVGSALNYAVQYCRQEQTPLFVAIQSYYILLRPGCSVVSAFNAYEESRRRGSSLEFPRAAHIDEPQDQRDAPAELSSAERTRVIDLDHSP